MTHIQQVIEDIKKNPGSTAMEVQARLGVTQAQASGSLLRAVDQRRLSRKKAMSPSFKNVGVWRYYPV